MEGPISFSAKVLRLCPPQVLNAKPPALHHKTQSENTLKPHSTQTINSKLRFKVFLRRQTLTARSWCSVAAPTGFGVIFGYFGIILGVILVVIAFRAEVRELA